MFKKRHKDFRWLLNFLLILVLTLSNTLSARNLFQPKEYQRTDGPAPTVTDPIRCPDAFGLSTAQAAQSQAAFLLILGFILSGDLQALQEQAKASGHSKDAELLPKDDLSRLRVPDLSPASGVVPREAVFRFLAARFGLNQRQVSSGQISNESRERIATAVYTDKTPLAAAALMETCLHHESDLVRVAAASAYFDVGAAPTDCYDAVVAGTRSDSTLAREIALTTLGRIAPNSEALRQSTDPTCPPGTSYEPPAPSHTAILVHGTFAKCSGWWQPGGDFFEYFKSNVDGTAYGAADRFRWSGGYAPWDRWIAASELNTWLMHHTDYVRPVLVGHSHGCNVIFMKTRYGGPKTGELILLSCPVRFPLYYPNFDNIEGRVVSVRVHLDLVILADRSGQRFLSKRIQEHILPEWFTHSFSHDSEKWRTHDVKRWVLPDITTGKAADRNHHKRKRRTRTVKRVASRDRIIDRSILWPT